MTIEEKAKAYDKALERAKEWFNPEEPDSWTCIVESIFPELRKSEDERVRKMIINHLTQERGSLSNYEAAEAISWLEKQGINNTNKECNEWELEWIEIFRNANEQYQMSQNSVMTKDAAELTIKGLKRLYLYDIVKEYILDEYQNKEKVSTDIVKDKNVPTPIVSNKPKFKVGDWVVDKSGLAQQILYFRGGIYTCTYNSFIIDCESNYHLWTIQDAKEGDVIYLPNGNNEYYFFIFKGIENAAVMSFVHFYQYNDGTSKVEETIYRLSSVNDVFRPATKEQRDLLFQKMHEAGYMWDSESKQLLSLKAEPSGEQKPAWSEEDEAHIHSLLDRLNGMCKKGSTFITTRFAVNQDIDWLKSLKQRIGG